MSIEKKSRKRNLTIPWARNQNGEPQKAGDPNLQRGLACGCKCPNCDDQLVHRHGSLKRPHFAHYSKQPTQSCFESSVHLAYKNAFLGTEGSRLKLPQTAEPTAMGKETWRMDPDFTVASAQTEVLVELPDGTQRIADVMITGEDGRRLLIEIAVTNPKDEIYRNQMKSLGLLAVEHQAKVSDPNDEVPSAEEILVQSTWLWEPYSEPLRESKEARRVRDSFLTYETQIQAAARTIQSIALKARENPVSAHENLTSINRLVAEIHPNDDFQKRERESMQARIDKGLVTMHVWVEEAERGKYRDLVTTIKPVGNPKLQRIEKDKFDNSLRRDTRHTLNQRARTVAELGFRQQDSRPTLFRARTAQWTIYVDFDSTDVMRIWEVDCEPAIYAFPDDDMAEREMLLAAVGEVLENAGVPYRRHFMDTGWTEPSTCPICRGPVVTTDGIADSSQNGQRLRNEIQEAVAT